LSLLETLKRRRFDLKRYLRENVLPYANYVAQSFAPYVIGYGLIVAVPMDFLFGYGVGPRSVLSWGLLFYLVDEELVGWLNQIKPHIRVTSK